MNTAELVTTNEATISAVEAFGAAIRSISSTVPAVVENEDQLALAQNNMKAARALKKTINEKRLSLTRPYDEMKKQIKADFDIPVDQLDNIDNAFKAVIKPYIAKVEAERQAAIEETRRIEREAQERRIAEQREAERQAREKEEEDSILARSQAKKIREEAQRKLDEEPPAKETLPEVVAAPKVNRQMFNKKYRAEVVDESVLPSEFWIIDQKKLDTLARSNKGQNPPAGVVFVEVD